MRTFTLLIVLLLLAACSPDGRFVFVTHTPSAQPTPSATAPSFATNTRTPTPLPSPTVGEPTPTEEFVDIEHAGWDNWRLQGPYTVTETHSNRIVAVPAGWQYVYVPSPQRPSLVGPFVFNRSDHLLWELSWVAGTFGLRQDAVFLETGRRYLFKAVWDVECQAGVLCDTTTLNSIHVAGQICNASTGTCTTLSAWNLWGGEALWVVETPHANVTATFALHFVLNPHATFVGSVRLYEVSLLRVPPDYGGDSVIGF